MLDNEADIAHFLLGCNTIVFIAETAFASRVRPYVGHETMYACIAYYLVVRASSRRVLSKSTRAVWACVTWVALCSIPSIALVSMLYNFRHSIVDCIVNDASINDASCRLGGDRRRCESFALAAMRQTVQEGCATFVLGPFLGTLYATMVFLLRFLPSFIGGVYFAFYFNENRLYVPGATSLRVPTNGLHENDPPLPSSLFYITWSLLLWGAFALEFAAGKHAELSSYNTMILFQALALVQIYRSQEGRSSDSNLILRELQFIGSMVLVFFAYMDFLRNAVGLASTCVGSVDYKVLAECRGGDVLCLETMNALSTSFFRQHDCPQLGPDSMQYVYFYLSQVLRLVFLCVVYPAAMVHRHLQQDRSEDGSRVSSASYLRRQIDDTPASKLKDMLVTAAEMDLQQVRDEK